MDVIESTSVLFKRLEDGGWIWRDGVLYAPHGSIWVSEDWPSPWQDIDDFQETVTARLKRLTSKAPSEPPGEGQRLLQEAIDDTRALVDALAEVRKT